MKFKRYAYNFFIGLGVFLFLHAFYGGVFKVTPLALSLKQYGELKAALVTILIVVLTIIVIYGFNRLKFKISDSIFFIIVFIVSTTLRMIWVYCIPKIPGSDFEQFNDAAKEMAAGIKFKSGLWVLFPHKFGYASILTIIYKIFGYHMIIAKTLNVLFSVGSIFLVYWIANMIFDKKVARISAVLLALYPTNIMYCSVLGTEHSFTFFFLAAIGMMIKYRKAYELKNIYKVFFIGILIALANFIRPVTLILFPAFILFLALDSWEGNLKVVVINKCKTMIVIVAGFLLTFSLLAGIVKYQYGVSMWNSCSQYSLMVGTDSKHGGMFSQIGQEVVDSSNFGYNVNRVKKESMKHVWKNLSTDNHKFKFFFEDKYFTQWSNDNYGVIFGLLGNLYYKNDITLNILSNQMIFWTVCQYFYNAILFFAFIGCIFSISMKNSKLNYTAALLVITFEGFVGSHTLLEVQPRYHHGLVPIFIVVASYGINKLCELIANSKIHCKHMDTTNNEALTYSNEIK